MTEATVFFAIVTLVTVHFSTISGEKKFLVFNVIACSHFEAVFPTAEVRKSMR